MTAAVFAAVFVALFAGHHVGDHLAQTDWSASHKAGPGWTGARAMASHLGSYLACQAAALGGLWLIGVPLTWLGAAAALVFSGATHGFIDRRWPVRWLLEHTGSADFADRQTPICGMYLADQSLHVGCLFVAALLAAGGAR